MSRAASLKLACGFLRPHCCQAPNASLANIIFFVAASAATAMGGGRGVGGSGLEVCGRVLCVVGGEVKNPSGMAGQIFVIK